MSSASQSTAPHNSAWVRVAPDLWCWFRYDPKLVPRNSVALALNGGSALVYNPTSGLSDEGYAELERTVGKPSWLLVPNHFHAPGVRAWKRRYPDAQVAASDAAIPRLKRKLSIEFSPLASLARLLPAACTILQPPGTRNGELWLRFAKDGHVTWVVGDAWNHFGRIPLGRIKCLALLLGIGAKPVVSRSWKLLLREKATYRDWTLERLEQDPPNTLVPMHGRAIEGAAVLRATLERALGSP